MNSFRTKLSDGRPLLGLWQALACPYTAEICARAGLDWLLFDGEHAPNTAQTLLAQLQAVAAFPVDAVARVPVGDPIWLKTYLDLGFQTLLVPMVDGADQARAIVSATRFPPRGVRGVASATSRASGFGANKDYLATAHETVCLIAQIETRAGFEAAESIATVDGVDCLFVGPADLAASLGHLGNPAHPDVQAAIDRTLAIAVAAGKPVGIFATSEEDARRRLGQGFGFVSVGTDIGLLATAVNQLRSSLTPT